MKKLVLLAALFAAQAQAGLNLKCSVEQNSAFDHKVHGVGLSWDPSVAPFAKLTVVLSEGLSPQVQTREIVDANSFEVKAHSDFEGRQMMIVKAGWEYNEHWLELESTDQGKSFTGTLVLDEDFEFDMSCKQEI